MSQVQRRVRRAVFGVAAATLVLGVTGVAGVGADEGSSGGSAGCGTAQPSVSLDVWALYGRQAPLVGDPGWGVTSRSYALPVVVAPGRYRVFGVSEDNLSAPGQEHEQWAVEVGGVRSGFMPDIPEDAVWFAQGPSPDDDGELATVPSWVQAQLPGFDLGVVAVSEPVDSLTVVHIEHDGQLEPWSPNSVNDRFITLACVPEETTTTTTTTTTAPPTTVPPTTVAPTTVAPTTVAPTTEAPQTTVASEQEVSPESVQAQPELAFTGTDVATLGAVGAAMVVSGLGLVRCRRGPRRAR